MLATFGKIPAAQEWTASVLRGASSISVPTVRESSIFQNQAAPQHTAPEMASLPFAASCIAACGIVTATRHGYKNRGHHRPARIVRNSRAIDTETLDKVFNRLDKDSSGSLDRDEIKEGLNLLFKQQAQDLSDVQLERMLRVFDQDGDGNVTLKEWRVSAVKASEIWQTLNPDMDNLLEGLSSATLAELEVQYIEAVFNYYRNNPQISDDEFEELKTELQWQGSSFLTLTRDEIRFIEASMAYYRGESIMSDEEFASLKDIVKTKSKRSDISAFLLYVKGTGALTKEQFAKAKSDLEALAMDDVKLTDDLASESDYQVLIESQSQLLFMLGALGFAPFLVSTLACGSVLWIFLGLGKALSLWPLSAAVGFAAAIPITQQLLVFLELESPTVLRAKCPSCGVRRNFCKTDNDEDLIYEDKCGNCGHQVIVNLEECRMEPKRDLKKEKSVLKKTPAMAALPGSIGLPVARPAWQHAWGSSAKMQEPRGSGLSRYAVAEAAQEVGEAEAAPAKKPVPKAKAKAKAKARGKKVKVPPKFGEQFFEGLFAPTILFGYWLFGEKFVSVARGKGIAKHSQAITAFCERFGLRTKKKQRFIKTAKKTGHDLGFLLEGGIFKNGKFEKEAMDAWKSSGVAKW